MGLEQGHPDGAQHHPQGSRMPAAHGKWDFGDGVGRDGAQETSSSSSCTLVILWGWSSPAQKPPPCFSRQKIGSDSSSMNAPCYCRKTFWEESHAKYRSCLKWTMETPLSISQSPLSGFPGGSDRRPGFDPWVGKILWRREWKPSPVFLPEKSLWQRSLVGYSRAVGHDWATNTFNFFHTLPVPLSSTIFSLPFPPLSPPLGCTSSLPDLLQASHLEPSQLLPLWTPAP